MKKKIGCGGFDSSIVRINNFVVICREIMAKKMVIESSEEEEASENVKEAGANYFSGHSLLMMKMMVGFYN